MASLFLNKAPATRFSTAIRSLLPSLSSPSLQHRTHNFSTSPLNKTSNTNANMSAPFLDAIKARRTIYKLAKSSTISDAKIQEIIKETVLHVPHSFNAQSTRIVLLVKEEHDKLWQIAKDVLKAIVPADAYPATETRLDGFQKAYGTVLFFENRPTTQAMQNKLPMYADRFPVWAGHSDAMSQFTIWNALELEGLGCNLQHYNPLIDAKVQDTWGISKDWELSAQLVFGKPEGPPGEKTFDPVEERFKSFGV
ncbi:putative nitroreductase HBN1 [Lachnellula suecica]|uniref:Putative nitroreductase HBN1 n=1 Tax=Lachnellula suecica TaxID=602035 RepID=A0A8T9BUZ8_9HELO|nr:putative nitroreductase HBN1 [Lachnellula suecica]